MIITSLPVLPLEIQLEVITYLYDISPASYASCLRLSRAHHHTLAPLLYRCICIRSRLALEGLASTLVCRPDLLKFTRTFFFQGPQGKRRTGRDQLRLLMDEDEEEEDDFDNEGDEGEGDDDRIDGQEPRTAAHSRNNSSEAKESDLEPGIEGEGQEATWDEHETLMHLCTLVLRLCSNHLQSIGFVDCVPWFLAPSEVGALNIPLPKCKDFTGVTVGLFGLLPHLQRKKDARENDNGETTWTSLERIHLIGGDFGSFALQRVLLFSPTSTTLTHLHITAPTLYRPEHHSHLVMHIVGLLRNAQKLKRISVGFLHWYPAPPPSVKKKDVKSKSMRKREDSNVTGTGEDSFERGQLRDTQRTSDYTSLANDDRLSQCRDAYIRALPEALQQSQREDCTVAIVELPFAEGTPVGFAGWILSHHATEDNTRRSSSKSRSGKPLPGEEATHGSWIRRDLSKLPKGIADDGAPQDTIWEIESTLEWSFEGQRLQLIKGKDCPWLKDAE